MNWPAENLFAGSNCRGYIYRAAAAVNWYRVRCSIGLTSGYSWVFRRCVCMRTFPTIYIAAQYKHICRCRLNGNRAVMLIRRLGFLLFSFPFFFVGQLRFARNGLLYRENPFSISMRSFPALCVCIAASLSRKRDVIDIPLEIQYGIIIPVEWWLIFDNLIQIFIVFQKINTENILS